MTATRLVRILYQATFLALFLWLLERLAAGDPRAWPYALFQWFDPLAGAGVPLAAKTLPAALAYLDCHDDFFIGNSNRDSVRMERYRFVRRFISAHPDVAADPIAIACPNVHRIDGQHPLLRRARQKDLESPGDSICPDLCGDGEYQLHYSIDRRAIEHTEQ